MTTAYPVASGGGELGPDGVMQTVQNLPDNAALDFLWGTAGERLGSLFDGVSPGTFDKWYASLPRPGAGWGASATTASGRKTGPADCR